MGLRGPAYFPGIKRASAIISIPASPEPRCRHFNRISDIFQWKPGKAGPVFNLGPSMPVINVVQNKTQRHYLMLLFQKYKIIQLRVLVNIRTYYCVSDYMRAPDI